MATEYEIGQEVLVNSVSEEGLSVREAALQPYVGQTGEILDKHWIRPPNNKIFYIYTVRMNDGGRELVLFEDEIQGISAAKTRSRKVKQR